MSEKIRNCRGIAGRILLALFNVAVILAAVLFTVYYSGNVRRQQEESKLNTFCNNVDTMKRMSERYLETELENARSFAKYIAKRNMTLDEAIDYINSIDDNTVCEAHFVDMETFEAWSTQATGDDRTIGVYRENYESNDERLMSNLQIMREMFAGEKRVLSRYKIKESQHIVVAVGTPATLREADGSTREYLLLRVIPINYMKALWTFPTTFPNAEIGLIATNADYVVPSAAMRSETFMDYVRYYNFADDYYGADQLLAQLKEQSSGLLRLNDYKKQSCYFYYSRLESFGNIDILGYVPVTDLASGVEALSIVAVVAGLIFLLVLIDGAVILNINRKLKEAAKVADKANRSKTQFLSTMSHDIRTPLNAVLGMTELAQNKIDDKDYVRECLRKISVSGNHLLTLINDVLEISRVESGKINITVAPFDVRMMISGLESITRSQAVGHGLKFEVKADDLPYPYLEGDRLRLTQICLNLLNNAVKYTKSGGRIFLEMREEAAEEDGKVMLVCIVGDTGIGMSQDFQRTMYDSFTRVADGRIDKIQGTGLGLSIVRHMVDLMNGSIACESEIDVGTTFTVRIPLSVAEERAVPAAESQKSDESHDLVGLHLLIAEDNDINWEIVSSMLEGYGIVCERAENGRECVDKLMAQIPGTYDLVLMDIQMPVMNGLEATKALRTSERMDLQQIPVVAMTADAFAEDVQSCIDAGMNAHIAKPIEIEKVLSAIRRLLPDRGNRRKE